MKQRDSIQSKVTPTHKKHTLGLQIPSHITPYLAFGMLLSLIANQQDKGQVEIKAKVTIKYTLILRYFTFL